MAKSEPILKSVPELKIGRRKAAWGDVVFVVQEHRQELLRKRWVDVSKEYYNLTSAKAALATKYLEYIQEGEFDGVNR